MVYRATFYTVTVGILVGTMLVGQYNVVGKMLVGRCWYCYLVRCWILGTMLVVGGMILRRC
jgi:hypothetical protein